MDGSWTKLWFSKKKNERTRPHFEINEKWHQVYEVNAPRNEWIIKVSVCHFISLCAFLWFVFSFFFLWNRHIYIYTYSKTHSQKEVNVLTNSYIFPEIILQNGTIFHSNLLLAIYFQCVDAHRNLCSFLPIFTLSFDMARVAISWWCKDEKWKKK